MHLRLNARALLGVVFSNMQQYKNGTLLVYDTSYCYEVYIIIGFERSVRYGTEFYVCYKRDGQQYQQRSFPTGYIKNYMTIYEPKDDA